MAFRVVCLDGTDQIKVQPHPTNIARIFDCLGGKPVDAGNGSLETVRTGKIALSGKYLPGVGSQGDQVLRVLGNAFGDGIAEPIVRGYTFLSRDYVEGDEIVIVGFSRGATAARALAGLVAAQGLLDKERYDTTKKTDAYLRAISTWYKYREPNGDLVDQERLRLISGIADRDIPPLTAADYVSPTKVRAVAVFDTVSSLGIPLFGSGGKPTFDFSICNTALDGDIANGFHALAADEARDLFSPTFWAARPGVVQRVFAGCHSDVGGGYPNSGLSDCALEWMLEKLGEVGLAFDPTSLVPPLAPDPLAVAQDDRDRFPFKLTPRSARAFPDAVELSDSLRARASQATRMLPSSEKSAYRPRGTRADGSPLIP